LHCYSLCTDKSQFNRGSVNNTHNSRVWADENPHATVESNFQRFSVNEWCAVPDDQLIGPFILEGHLTRESYLRFLQEELPRLSEVQETGLFAAGWASQVEKIMLATQTISHQVKYITRQPVPLTWFTQGHVQELKNAYNSVTV